jgi:hypothetical protein
MADAPAYREFDMLTEVIKADPDYYKPGVAYKFSNGREFLCDDDSENGIYKKD